MLPPSSVCTTNRNQIIGNYQVILVSSSSSASASCSVKRFLTARLLRCCVCCVLSRHIQSAFLICVFVCFLRCEIVPIFGIVLFSIVFNKRHKYNAIDACDCHTKKLKRRNPFHLTSKFCASFLYRVIFKPTKMFCYAHTVPAISVIFMHRAHDFFSLFFVYLIIIIIVVINIIIIIVMFIT